MLINSTIYIASNVRVTVQIGKDMKRSDHGLF